MIKHKFRQSLYLQCLGCFFILVWLLPNHYPPWPAFHNDAFAAAVLLLAAGVVSHITAARQVAWHWQTVVVLSCLFIPLAQYLTGQIVWFGTAWINMAYLLGLACAMTLGAHWERYAPGRCGDFLFASIVVAGLLSMLIGLCQWLDINVSEFWVLKTDGRPVANLSQANQTATLYVLSALGCLWLFRRKKISGLPAAFLTTLLLIGLAMSGSRTAWVNALIVAAALMGWSYKSGHKRWAIVAVAGLSVLALFVVLLPWLSSLLQLAVPADWGSRSLLNSRDVIWTMVWDAATRHPVWGYGWGQTLAASLKAAVDHPPLTAVTTHSHNLFLDLLLWNGLILGGFICLTMTCWLLWITVHLKTIGQLVLLLCLSVLGFHAMTEYPLHYAYFLLPAGMIAGMLGQQSGAPVAVKTSTKPMVVMFACAAIALAVTVRDYLRVETGITAIRFESALIKHDLPTTPPDVWVLTDLRAAIVMARWQPQKGTSAEDLNTMKSVAQIYASPNNIFKVAQAYGLNNDLQSATHWLQIGCNTAEKFVCKKMQALWESDRRLTTVPWLVQ